MGDVVKPLKIAILAMGGQGGGVLTNWLIEVAERAGWLAQSTAVPGVAQRTGATVYYLELLPWPDCGQESPVLALMPVPGHVDVVVAGELAEAGRAVLRGLVTRDRTRVIVSTHRDFAVGEKTVVGDGRADSGRLTAIVRENAKQFVGFDMAALAEETGSVISSLLLGAIAGAGIAPFGKQACTDVIAALGVAVAPNLRGFEAGYRQAGEQPRTGERVEQQPGSVAAPGKQVQALLDRVDAEFPLPCRGVVLAGLRKLIDYQDLRYALAFLERLAPFLELDGAGRDYRLTVETARYLALGMAYEDVIRVADLKTRSARFARVRQEAQADATQVVRIEEFMHPRVEEVCDIMPAWAGRWCMNTAVLRNTIAFFCRKGRRIRTTSLPGFLLLYLLAGLRRFRRGTLRYRAESAELDRWLATVRNIAPCDYALAVEVAECRRLVKGYGETHARGLANFRRIMAALDEIRAEPGAAAAVRARREAALGDAEADALAAP